MSGDSLQHKHRRWGSRDAKSSFAQSDVDDDAPTTTTRAMLISVITPCYFTMMDEDYYHDLAGSFDSEDKEQPDDNDDNAINNEEATHHSTDDKATNQPPTGTNLPGALADGNHPLLSPSHSSENSNDTSTTPPPPQHRAKKSSDSLAGIAKALGLSKKSSRESTQTSQNNLPDEDAIPMRETTVGTQKRNSRDRATTTRQEDESQEITPEEAAAVKVSNESSTQFIREIHVEELLRITFQNLLEDYHFLNVPTYSHVQDKKLKPHTATVVDNDNDNNKKRRSMIQEMRQDGAATAWIHAQVMARPSSLGIVLARLERIGVGTNVGTVSVFKAELCRTASPYLTLAPASRKSSMDQSRQESMESNVKEDSSHNNNSKTKIDNQQEEAAAAAVATKGFVASSSITTSMNKSETNSQMQADDSDKMRTERLIAEAKAEWKNAATRLRIEQVREQIVDSAALSFDFISLLTIAGILAGIGLITGNSVVIVASMLVSPIMGPVLGLTFGSRVKDWPLVTGSLYNESVALLGCLAIGVLIGITAGFTNAAQENWPTSEMESRGDYIGLLTGVAVAIPSGAGVCLSILGGNTSSLVGVAISASLLPPAVNAGICFMYAILLSANAVSTDSDYDAKGFARIGGISFLLTVINIICIWAAGLVMFHIKEVAPTESKGAFWARDIKAARELNKKRSKEADDDGSPPPLIDWGILKQGLQSALTHRRRQEQTGGEEGEDPEDKLKPIKTVRIKPPPRLPSSSRYDQTNLNSAFAFKPSKPKSFYRYREVPQVWEDARAYRRDSNPWRLEEEKAEDESDAFYVDLTDMAVLLGLEEEEEQDINIFWQRVPPKRGAI